MARKVTWKGNYEITVKKVAVFAANDGSVVLELDDADPKKAAAAEAKLVELSGTGLLFEVDQVPETKPEHGYFVIEDYTPPLLEDPSKVGPPVILPAADEAAIAANNPGTGTAAGGGSKGKNK